MLHTSTQQLIRKLCELTDSGAINWTEGEDQCSVFETEGYLVEIRAEPASVRLLRADGHELERADADDLTTAWPDGESTYATHVADMARRASRIARGAETAIAKILSSLSAPPKKLPEPEPEPAALAFAAAADQPPQSVRASESAAAIAAVTADLESQRRKVAEDPPVSHALPEAPVVVTPPETETAIDRVLAVQPVVKPEPAKEEPPKPEPAPVVETMAPPPPQPAPAPVAAAPQPAPIVEAKPQPLPMVTTRAIDLPPPFADSTMQPQLTPQIAAPVAMAPPLPKAEPAAPAPIQPVSAATAAPAKRGFGSIDSFTRARADTTPAPPAKIEPKVEASKITSTGLLVSGISARSKQTVEPSTTRDFYRPIEPKPPAPVPQPVADKKREPAIATGANIYKPWA